MNKYYAITYISEIRGHVSAFIEEQLREFGIEGLVASHGSILTALYYNEGKLPMKDIAERIRRTKSTVTQLVDKLIKAGYVEKVVSEEDGRVHYIILTEKGWGIKDSFTEISRRVNETFYQGVSDQEAEVLVQLLAKIKANFEE